MRNKQRKYQRDFYEKTQRNQNAELGAVTQKVPKKTRDGPTPRWHYWLPTAIIPPVAWVALIIFVQYVAMTLHNIVPKNKDVGLMYNFGLWGIYFGVLVFVMPLFTYWLYRKFHATWFNNNAMYLSEDIQEYTNDAYIRTMDHISQELDFAPDIGLGFDGHVSTIMGHAMISNKGIKKVNMPVYDPNVDGFVKKDSNGNIVKKMVPMFDKQLADKLFSMSGVPNDQRKLYDATDYIFNRKLTRKEGGGKDEKGNAKRAGAYGRKPYDKLSDYINNEFYPLDTDTARPAGVYFYDNRPVNTILIAITRGGKGKVPGLLGDQQILSFKCFESLKLICQNSSWKRHADNMMVTKVEKSYEMYIRLNPKYTQNNGYLAGNVLRAML